MFRRLRKRRWWKFEPGVELPLLAGFVAILGFLAYSFVSKICSWGKPGKYCDRHETWAWLMEAGGWWKFAIFVLIIGLLTIPDWDGDLRNKTNQSEKNDIEPTDTTR